MATANAPPPTRAKFAEYTSTRRQTAASSRPSDGVDSRVPVRRSRLYGWPKAADRWTRPRGSTMIHERPVGSPRSSEPVREAHPDTREDEARAEVENGVGGPTLRTSATRPGRTSQRRGGAGTRALRTGCTRPRIARPSSTPRRRRSVPSAGVTHEERVHPEDAEELSSDGRENGPENAEKRYRRADDQRRDHLRSIHPSGICRVSRISCRSTLRTVDIPGLLLK